jgi:signal peptidase I
MKRVVVVLLILVVLAAAVIKFLVIELPRVGGDDMAPALQPGDLLLAYRLDTTPRRGQLVLLEHPASAGRLLIRRVYGLPGDRVAVKQETPLLNGRKVPRRVVEQVVLEGRRMKVVEEIIDGATRVRVLKDPGRRSVDAREVVLENAYYVLADNRNHGTDSRTFGPVPADRIRAVVTHRVSAGPGCLEGQPEREGWFRFEP